MNYTGVCMLTEYHAVDDLCELAVMHNQTKRKVGRIKALFAPNEKKALIAILQNHGQQEATGVYKVPVGICIEISFKGLKKELLVKPTYKRLAIDYDWKECTWTKLNLAIYQNVNLTNLKKRVWLNPLVTKEDYLDYLLMAAEKMLPFLQNRLLTVKRYPDGVEAEGFYQKSTPEYAPEFVEKVLHNGNLFTICDSTETLLWLGNQATIEFHIPFNTYQSNYPAEIVFDLDPPSIGNLDVAVKAALEMKKIFDQFQLMAFAKLSGRKGIQIHLPLNDGKISYQETRVFTEFIARYLIDLFPDLFTIERLKKNRGNRLYIDYIQHEKEKTIICPYSPRETSIPGIAVPLYWSEIKPGITINEYLLPTVKKRLASGINPFEEYFDVKQTAAVKHIIDFIQTKNST